MFAEDDAHKGLDATHATRATCMLHIAPMAAVSDRHWRTLLRCASPAAVICQRRFNFRMSLAAACATKRRAENAADKASAELLGFSTRAILDAGATSVRVKMPTDCIDEPGIHLAAISTNNSSLPAVAAVPGDTPDSRGSSRRGLAELMVLARPVAEADGSCSHVTCLTEDVLREYFSNHPIELVSLQRIAAFEEGMGDARWLRPRLHALMDAIELHSAGSQPGDVAQLLRGTGLSSEPARVESIAIDGSPSRGDHGDQLCGGGSWRSPSRPFGGREQYEI